MRILPVLAIVAGILLGITAVTTLRTVVLSGSSANPACSLPLLGIGCTLGLAPKEVPFSVSIDGLGILVVQTVLFSLLALAIVGVFALLLLNRRGAVRPWAGFILLVLLAFVAAFSLGYAVFVLEGFSCQSCEVKRTVAKDVLAGWILVGAITLALTGLLFVRAARFPPRGGEVPG